MATLDVVAHSADDMKDAMARAKAILDPLSQFVRARSK
jgi:hypothetical protein